jgi:hypothetical protein
LPKGLETLSAQGFSQVQRLGVLELVQVVTRQATVLQRRDQALPARRIQQTGGANSATDRIRLTAVKTGVRHAPQLAAAAVA